MMSDSRTLRDCISIRVNGLPHDYCPKCRKPTEYIPNPYYIAECNIAKCGWSGTESELLSIDDVLFGKDESNER